MNRKTTPKVKDGKVQKKNRHEETPNYWNTRQSVLQIDIESPGKGYKHFLKKRDIVQFLEILPHWEEIKIEFDAILLARGNGRSDGWYVNGVVGICAWDKNMTCFLYTDYFNEHKELFDRLELRYEIKKDGALCHFDEYQIKAYQLLHILLHEIGHHHDRINTKWKNSLPNGEPYAESYAYKYEKIIWNRYFDTFGR
ncbi:MAG: hypothetical protein QM762_09170 [Chryseolinea sp.]